MQECGGCTACCWAFRVTEAGKQAQEKCQYEKHGCTIYHDRPKVCRDYECAWLTQPKISIDLRPDKCGAIFTLMPDNIIIVTPLVKGLRGLVEKQIIEFKKQGYAISYDGS